MLAYAHGKSRYTFIYNSKLKISKFSLFIKKCKIKT